MRVLLDAHISGRRVGEPLRREGHDVRALSEEPDAADLPDADVLELAARETRILVTVNSHDFVPLTREWAEAGQSHAGFVIVYGLDHANYGPLPGGLRRLFGLRPAQADWANITDALSYRRA